MAVGYVIALTQSTDLTYDRALHGKMLRLDVHQRPAGKQYGIPSDNPFADGVAGAPEVLMLGLRNPWRWSFDRATGDIWIGDVGQDQIEELDIARASEQAGKNFGWSAYEGNSCCATQTDKCTQAIPQQACDPAGKTLPVDSRTHASGWASIIGGQVYRGTCYPDLVGWYFYTDHVKGGLVKARLRPDGTLEIVDLPSPRHVPGPADQPPRRRPRRAVRDRHHGQHLSPRSRPALTMTVGVDDPQHISPP